MLRHQPRKEIDFEARLKETEQRLKELRRSLHEATGDLYEEIQSEMIGLEELRETLFLSIEAKRNIVEAIGESAWHACANSPTEDLHADKARKEAPALKPEVGYQSFPRPLGERLRDDDEISTTTLRSFVPERRFNPLWRFFKVFCLCGAKTKDDEEMLLNDNNVRRK